MRHLTFILLSLVLLTSGQAQAIFHGAHVQWKVTESEKSKLQSLYHVRHIRFTKAGHPIMLGLSPEHQKRWYNFYRQCMSDGCMYCDASEGSCEKGTCGPNNSRCKPRMSRDKIPECGYDCAFYALSRL